MKGERFVLVPARQTGEIVLLLWEGRREHSLSGSSVAPGAEYTFTYTGRWGVEKTGVYLNRNYRKSGSNWNKKIAVDNKIVIHSFAFMWAVGNVLFYGDEENGRCSWINGNSTTAVQSEIRKANLVSVLSDKNVAGKGGYAWTRKITWQIRISR